jgi:hypothetical protein
MALLKGFTLLNRREGGVDLRKNALISFVGRPLRSPAAKRDVIASLRKRQAEPICRRLLSPP